MILGSISAISSSQNVLNFPPFCTSGWKSFSNLVPRALGCRRSFYWGSSGAHLGKGPPYFYTKLRPEGGEIFWNRPPPSPSPLSQGLDDIWGSGSCTTGFIFFSNLVNRIWLWTLKDRFNEQRHPVDKTKIKSKPTAFSEHPEHFLSHSDHSAHTDMQLIPRGNSFFTWLRTQGEGVTFDMICYPGMELKVRKKFSVTEKVSELLEKNWSSIKRRQLLLFLPADCIACSEFTLRKLDHLS